MTFISCAGYMPCSSLAAFSAKGCNVVQIGSLWSLTFQSQIDPSLKKMSLKLIILRVSLQTFCHIKNMMRNQICLPSSWFNLHQDSILWIQVIGMYLFRFTFSSIAKALIIRFAFLEKRSSMLAMSMTFLSADWNILGQAIELPHFKTKKIYASTLALCHVPGSAICKVCIHLDCIFLFCPLCQVSCCQIWKEISYSQTNYLCSYNVWNYLWLTNVL